jgi:hypothetical protein
MKNFATPPRQRSPLELLERRAGLHVQRRHDAYGELAARLELAQLVVRRR